MWNNYLRTLRMFVLGVSLAGFRVFIKASVVLILGHLFKLTYKSYKIIIFSDQVYAVLIRRNLELFNLLSTLCTKLLGFFNVKGKYYLKSYNRSVIKIPRTTKKAQRKLNNFMLSYTMFYINFCSSDILLILYVILKKKPFFNIFFAYARIYCPLCAIFVLLEHYWRISEHFMLNFMISLDNLLIQGYFQ